MVCAQLSLFLIVYSGIACVDVYCDCDLNCYDVMWWYAIFIFLLSKKFFFLPLSTSLTLVTYNLTADSQGSFRPGKAVQMRKGGVNHPCHRGLLGRLAICGDNHLKLTVRESFYKRNKKGLTFSQMLPLCQWVPYVFFPTMHAVLFGLGKNDISLSKKKKVGK